MNPLLLRIPLLIASVALLASCGKREAAPQASLPVVGVLTAQASDVPLTKHLVGRLSAYFSANVTARVSGVLLKRLYTEGADVRQGQPLFQIDPSYYRTLLNNDLATLAQDQATYEFDKVTSERDRALLPAGSVSRETVDNAESTTRSALAKVKADQAAVDGARINLGYTAVTSPISGIAGEQQVTVGAIVGSGTSDGGSGGTLLATVQQIDPVYVNFTISAADLITLRQAADRGNVALAAQNRTPVKLVLPNGSAYQHDGTVDFSDAEVNATTGAVNVRAIVPNPKHELLPGMYVTLSVDLGVQNGVFLVPQQAVLRDTVGPYALVVQAGTVARRNIGAVDSIGNDWIVTAGLVANDSVIVSGLQSVHEGEKVRAVRWSPTDAPAASSVAGR